MNTAQTPTEKFLELRLESLKANHNQLVGAMGELENKKNELVAHINAHRGKIEEIHDILAHLKGAKTDGKDADQGAPRGPDGQAEQVPRRLDEPPEVAIG